MSDDRIEQSSGAGNAAAGDDSSTQDIAASKESYARSLNEQGTWFVTTGQPHLAVRCFRRACVACPPLATAWTNLATTLVLLGRNRDALQAIRSAARIGALSHSAAALYRTAINQNFSPDQLTVKRHPVERARKKDEPIRRPRSGRKVALRRNATIYTLLRSAAYDIICEGKIPAS